MTITVERGLCTARTPGLVGYKHDGCRCSTCTAASIAYDTRRSRQIAYGRWQPLVDADPVRAHLRKLMASGLGWQRAAGIAGIADSTVSRILYGRHDKPPNKRVRPAIAQALLAIKPSIDLLAAGTVIDATGTRRRTQALAAIGWSVNAQAARLGRTGANHKLVLTNPGVTVATDRMVREL